MALIERYCYFRCYVHLFLNQTVSDLIELNLAYLVIDPSLSRGKTKFFDLRSDTFFTLYH
jgi:hypothetical protein